VRMLGGEPLARASRTPEIMADAAHAILTRPSREFSGNFCIDDLVLWEAGVRDFSKYAAVPGTKDEALQIDFFVPDDTPQYVFVLPTLLGYDKENPRTVLRLYRSAPFIMAKGVMDDGGEERTGEAVAAGARH